MNITISGCFLLAASSKTQHVKVFVIPQDKMTRSAKITNKQKTLKGQNKAPACEGTPTFSIHLSTQDAKVSKTEQLPGDTLPYLRSPVPFCSYTCTHHYLSQMAPCVAIATQQTGLITPWANGTASGWHMGEIRKTLL